MEFKLDKASDDMVFEKKQWKPANLNAARFRNSSFPTVRKGELFFTPDNEDRKATGSYYTPHYAVEHLVRSTLGPLVKNRKSSELREIRVCDPAMGSGHFISAALTFLSKTYFVTRSEELGGQNATFREATREILKNCIYGIDINPRAVKLAKMSLWLSSATASEKLEDLSDQLVCSNSLSSSLNLKRDFPNLDGKGFDAIIGNPPWVFCKYHDFNLQSKSDWPSNLIAAHGKVNLYSLFLERSFDLLRDGGIVNLLIPNTFLRITTQKELRKKLVYEYRLEEVIDFGDGVFEDVTASTIAVRFKKDSADKYKIKITDYNTNSSHEVLSTSVNDDSGYVIPGAMNQEDLEVIRLIEDGADSFLLDKFIFMNGVATKSGKSGMSNKKEDSRYKRTLEGKDISPYQWHFKSKYLCYDKKFLECARDEEKFLADWKLVGQRITGGTRVMTWALDEEQHYTFNSVNNLIPKDFNDRLKLFYVGYLNSDVVNMYMCAKFTNKSKLTVNMSKAFLECLPLPTIVEDSMLKDINKVVEALIDGKDKKEELNGLIVEVLEKAASKRRKKSA